MTGLTNPQGSGAMTLDQGVAHLKAKMARSGATADDQAVIAAAEDALSDLDDETQGGAQIEAMNADDVVDAGDGSDADLAPEAEAPADEYSGKILLPDGSEVTVEEARKGYLRQSDYTRKTQALAQEREHLAAREQAAFHQLQGLYQHMASYQEAEPDWLALSRDRSPAEFQQIQAYWRHKSAVMNQARTALQAQNAQAFTAQQAQALEVLSSGDYEPAWKDRKGLEDGLKKVTQYLTDNYRTLDEGLLSAITNPDVVIIADKARRFDELQKAKPRAALAVRGKPAPFKPGSKTTASPQSETIRLLNERFQANPTVDNAVALQKAKAARRTS